MLILVQGRMVVLEDISILGVFAIFLWIGNSCERPEYVSAVFPFKELAFSRCYKQNRATGNKKLAVQNSPKA